MFLDLIDISIRMQEIKRDDPELFISMLAIFLFGIAILELILCTIYALQEKEINMRYRKKPVIVEAVKYEGGLIRESKYPKWFLEAVNKRVISTGVDITGDIKDAFPPKLIHFLKIETLEGTMRANKGDYVIKGVSGEIYPCKPDIFEKTYEKVME